MDLPPAAADDVRAQQTTTTAAGSDIITPASKADPTNNNNIVKGKRTKRQRPPPPTINNHPTRSFNSSSPEASSSEFPASSTTTEDEDTANCLILLSKGGPTHHHHHNNIISVDDEELFSGYKFNSKRYIQTSSSTEGLTTTGGIYVYECKTCSRTFPSFQALGGHRASHKKPKLLINKPPPPYNYTAFSDEDRKNNSPSNSSSLSLQLNNQLSVSYNNNNPKKSSSSSSKLHECSICGAEFNSGQALGGHMRRHRPANVNTTSAAGVTATNTTLSLIPYSPVNQKSRVNDDLGYLDLDLNLPAPSETAAVQGVSNQFTANQNNKQQPVVRLSATPTLVDCHY